MMPVMMPPVRKLIRRGARLAKSFAGETTLAAMLVESVAMASVISARTESTGLSKRCMSCTGSQIAFPKTIDGRARHRDADEGVEGHGERQPERLADDLVALRSSRSARSPGC